MNRTKSTLWSHTAPLENALLHALRERQVQIAKQIFETEKIPEPGDGVRVLILPL